jgi:hypothetical protein
MGEKRAMELVRQNWGQKASSNIYFFFDVILLYLLMPQIKWQFVEREGSIFVFILNKLKMKK